MLFFHASKCQVPSPRTGVVNPIANGSPRDKKIKGRRSALCSIPWPGRLPRCQITIFRTRAENTSMQVTTTIMISITAHVCAYWKLRITS